MILGFEESGCAVEREFEFDLICIGSGPAGQRGAVQAAKLGKRVAVIERRGTLGGGCLETGTIPSKTFREAVRHFRVLNDGPGRFRCDARPTAEDLLSRVGEVLTREARVVEDQLRRNDVALIRGRARFRDPHTLEVEQADGERRLVTAGHVLVAVGTEPTPPPGVPADGETVATSDDIVRLSRLPRRMAVVGAGVIGLEYASMFAALGVDVTLIDRRERPLEFVDREIVDELIHQMRNQNITFRLGEAVDRLDRREGAAPGAAILLESGKRIVSELVLFSIGRRGATADLDLPAAGLSTDERGRLSVDERYRTAVPHILAAGDVIGYPSLAATSSRQGRLAARFAFGGGDERISDSLDNYPVGIYAIPEISMIGKPEHELTRDRVPYETGIARYREIARGQILGDDSGLLKMLFHRETRELLGVHIIGTHATELLHIGQAVMKLGGGLDYFLDTVFNYPTLAECYKVAALDADNKLRM